MLELVGDLEGNETDDLEVAIDSMRSQKSTSLIRPARKFIYQYAKEILPTTWL